MGAWVEKHSGAPPARAELEERFRAERLSPRAWANAPGDRYSAHSHPYHKVLYCLSGSIVFHTADGDIELHPGDRLEVEAGTEHSATVGPAGVECLEAPLAIGRRGWTSRFGGGWRRRSWNAQASARERPRS